MNRSKIFLGATSTMLAIAGVAAARISNFHSSVTRYYCTKTAATHNYCAYYYPESFCIISSSGLSTCNALLNNTEYTLYTTRSVTIPLTCGTAATRATANCQGKVKYNVRE